MRATLAAPLLALAVAACAPATGPAPLARATGPEITPAELRHRLEIVAHDSMEGREVGTRGMERATRYLTAELERIDGLRPAGDDGGWLHRVALVRTRFSFAGSHTGAAGEMPLTLAELLPANGSGGVPSTDRTRAEGPLVFAGWQIDPGVTGPRELPSGAMDGAVVVVRMGAPPGVRPGPGVTPRLPLGRLISPGSPAAAVVLVAEGDLEDFWEYAKVLARTGVFTRGEPAPASAADGPLVLLAAPEAVERMIGRPLEDAPPAAGLGTVRLEVAHTREPVAASNVVAVLPGRDPARSGEYVALGAHHDHDGIGEAVDGDSIFNGADDDGSGTVAMLEIAEHLAALPPEQRPARSLLFVWHTAEEKGLLGSEAFMERPTVPREAIVAMLNLDMVGRNHPDSLLLVGSRRLSTELGDVVEAVNRGLERPFAFDDSWDRPGHPERIYCRSDHYHYARFGIPVAFFFAGLHEDYHEVGDEADRVDYDKLARVARLVEGVALELANRPGRPVVDRPVPPPNAPCS